MPKWKIEKQTAAYDDEDHFEEIEAETYLDTKDGKWVDFYNGSDKVLRLRTEDVLRIERIG